MPTMIPFRAARSHGDSDILLGADGRWVVRARWVKLFARSTLGCMVVRAGKDLAAGVQPRTKPRLIARPEEITHIVCCRDAEWHKGLCGFEDDDLSINPAAEMICTMCLEVAETMRPGWIAAAVCPLDGIPCPDEHEIDLRIASETEPT